MSYYTSIILMIEMATCVLAILIRENNRLSRAKKRSFYTVNGLLFLSALAEWGGVQISGNTAFPYWVLPTVKLLDYTLTPLTGGALIFLMLDDPKKKKILYWIFGAHTLLQIVSVFNEWMVVIDENNVYTHGPLYPIYTIFYVLVMVEITSSFLRYGRSFRRQNRTSLYGALIVLISGVLLQEFLSDEIRLVYLAILFGFVFLFIHYSEFSQMKMDEEIAKNQRELTAINESLRETDDIISHAGMGMWHIYLFGGEEPRMRANAMMRKLLAIGEEVTDEREIYKAWYSRIKPEALPSVQASVAEMMEGKSSENTYLWIHPTLGDQYVRCGGTGEEIPGKGWVLQGYHYNVTEQVLRDKAQQQAVQDALAVAEQSAQELKKALEAAEVAGRAKTDFLFSMSHDIRTPMNAIMGYTDLMAKNLDNPELLKDYLKKMEISNGFLMALINNVLEMARIESGKITL